MTTEFGINNLVFTVHNNEFRSSKVKRIITDAEGTNYVLEIDNKFEEKPPHLIAKSKEDLYNKMVNRHLARKQGN